MSVLGLGSLSDLDTLVKQQLSILTGEAEDKWALLHRHAGNLLPDSKKRKVCDDYTYDNKLLQKTLPTSHGLRNVSLFSPTLSCRLFAFYILFKKQGYLEEF